MTRKVDCRWSSDCFTVHEVIQRFNFPNLVRIAEGYYTENEEDTFAVGDVLLLNSFRGEVSFKVQPTTSEISSKPDLALPVDYKGKVVCEQKVIRTFKSVRELLKHCPDRIFLDSDLQCKYIGNNTLKLQKGSVLEDLYTNGNFLICKYQGRDVQINPNITGRFMHIRKDDEISLCQVEEYYRLPVDILFLETESGKVNQDSTCITGIYSLVERFEKYTVEGQQISEGQGNGKSRTQSSVYTNITLNHNLIHEISVYVDTSNDFCKDLGRSKPFKNELNVTLQQSRRELGKVMEARKKVPPLPPPRRESSRTQLHSVSPSATFGVPVRPHLDVDPLRKDTKIRNLPYQDAPTPTPRWTENDHGHRHQGDRFRSTIKIKVNPVISSTLPRSNHQRKGLHQRDKTPPPLPTRNTKQNPKPSLDAYNKFEDENPYMSMKIRNPGGSKFPFEKIQDTPKCIESLDMSAVPQVFRESLSLVHQELQFNIPMRHPERTLCVDRPVRRVSPMRCIEAHPAGDVATFCAMRVPDVVGCLNDCKLFNLAELCQEEGLDGSFIASLSKRDLRQEPFRLTQIQILKLEQIKKGWRPTY